MDELAYEVGIDPLELRLRNYTETNGNEGKRYSSKELRACYQQGAERFGWSRRPAQPRSLRDGHQLVGMGMATGVWEAMQMPASARACLDADGRLLVTSATADIGTGTYTAMTQIAADAMGLPMSEVEFRLVIPACRRRRWKAGRPPCPRSVVRCSAPAPACGRSCWTPCSSRRPRRSPGRVWTRWSSSMGSCG